MEDIAYLVSVQPIMVSIILIAVAVICVEIALDFILCELFPWWHSPYGLKARKRKRKAEQPTSIQQHHSPFKT